MSDDEAPNQQDEAVNMCLMMNDESTSTNSTVYSEPNSSNIFNTSHILEYTSDDESSNAVRKLQKDFEKLYEENMLLKERFVKINFSKEKLIKSSKNLELENSSLVITNESLQSEKEKLNFEK